MNLDNKTKHKKPQSASRWNSTSAAALRNFREAAAWRF